MTSSVTDDLKDFIVSVTDRRSELWGDAWNGHRRENAASRSADIVSHDVQPRVPLPTRLLPNVPSTAELDSLVEPETLPLHIRIAALLAYSVLPLRYEPMNPFPIHRGVASPGALYPLDTYVFDPDDTRTDTLRLDPWSRRLFQTGDVPSGEHGPGIGSVRIMAVGCFGRCAATYGPFGIFLMALEAGMVAAQWQLLGMKLGLPIRPVPPHDVEISGLTVAPRTSIDLPLSACDILTGDEAVTTLFEKWADRPESSESPKTASHPDLARTCLTLRNARATQRTSVPARYRSGDRMIADFPLFSATMNRGCGLPGIGWSRDWDAEAVGMLLRDVHRLANILDLGLDATAYATVAFRPRETDRFKLYEFQVEGNVLSPISVGTTVEVAARQMAGAGGVILVTLGFDDMAALEEGGGDLLTPHIAIGMLAQCFCLAAARAGAVARPYKANADRLANTLLPLRYRTLIQILISYDTRTNPGLAMGWA